MATVLLSVERGTPETCSTLGADLELDRSACTGQTMFRQRNLGDRRNLTPRQRHVAQREGSIESKRLLRRVPTDSYEAPATIESEPSGLCDAQHRQGEIGNDEQTIEFAQLVTTSTARQPSGHGGAESEQ